MKVLQVVSHQPLIMHNFSFHDLYISNMVSDEKHLMTYTCVTWYQMKNTFPYISWFFNSIYED